MREVVSTYQTVLNNIFLYQVDIDGNLIDYLEIIEYEDNLKLYASVWEVDNDGEMVLTKNGKVVISKEPSSMLLRLLETHSTKQFSSGYSMVLLDPLLMRKHLYTDRF